MVNEHLKEQIKGGTAKNYNIRLQTAYSFIYTLNAVECK